jgi:hypothetical protein
MKKKNSYLKEIFSISDKNLILFEFRVPNHAFEINKIKYKGTQFDAIIFDVDMKKIIGIEAKLMSDDSGSGDSGKSQLSRNLDVLTDIKKENTYWQGWNTEYYVICPKNLNTEYMVELYHNKENIKYLFWDDLYNKYLKEDKIIDTFINMKNNNGNGNDNGNGSNNYNDKLRQLVVGKFFKFKELKKE